MIETTIRTEICQGATVMKAWNNAEVNVSTSKFTEDADPYVCISFMFEDDSSEAECYGSITLGQEEAEELAKELHDASDEDPEPIMKENL